MKKQACVVGLILIVAAVAVVLYVGSLQEREDTEPFDNEGRYDSTILNNMGVIYENQSDIMAWNNGYSETDACPWGAEHNGLDYMFYNNSPVIAAAPGLVIDIELAYLPNSTIYAVGVHIQFNESVWLSYAFEGDGNETLRAQQGAMLDVEVGDWVAKGDQIGRFLTPVPLDHVHFGVYLNDEAICPRLVMGESDYTEIMTLVHSFHPTWELCYVP
jgi:murein DD-endopeptidase MepM/ murein hydrolase activator NlpD